MKIIVASTIENLCEDLKKEMLNLEKGVPDIDRFHRILTILGAIQKIAFLLNSTKKR